MRELTRRDMLATAAVAGGVLTSASVAMAQTSDQVLQPSRAPGRNRRYRSRPTQRNPRASKSGHAQSAGHGFRHDAEPPFLVC